MIRYRRDIVVNPVVSYVEYVKEKWEPVEVSVNSSFKKGLRLVDPYLATYRDNLSPNEEWAANNGWTPPADFTYVSELPMTAKEVPHDLARRF
jgi:hypothetical protein